MAELTRGNSVGSLDRTPIPPTPSSCPPTLPSRLTQGLSAGPPTAPPHSGPLTRPLPLGALKQLVLPVEVGTMRALGAEPRGAPPWDPAPEAAPGWGPSPTVTADLPSSPNPPEKGASIPVPVPQPAVPVPREQHQASLAGLTMSFICSHARRNGGPGPGQCTWKPKQTQFHSSPEGIFFIDV